MTENIASLFYLLSSGCFVLAIRGLSAPETANRGNLFGILGMVLAVATTLAMPIILSYELIIIGILLGGGIGTILALKTQMTALPQLVAAFNSLVGLAACFVAAAAFYRPDAYGIGKFLDVNTLNLIEMTFGLTVGAITFTGSIVAFGKLQGIIPGSPLTFKGQHLINAVLGLVVFLMLVWITIDQSEGLFWTILGLAFLLGVLVIVPIGGADMPVVISMLNSYSGWAACGIGFTLSNSLMIVTGALVGSSGAILSYIMCKGMNRSFFNVILGGFGGENVEVDIKNSDGQTIKSGTAEDAAFIMENASSVIIVPGYGMAVAQAQHALREMANKLIDRGIKVRYAIHPVAGRMPGHMNVLLAEANVPYEDVLELDAINRDFSQTDVAFVIGANDVTNPAAKTDSSSPIYGMPILDVENAKTVLFVKRSMASGYAGVDNQLFPRDNTMMLFSDAKKMCDEIVQVLG
ncbi:NAD(P)(+) transhydrogenase (Re/Si-specific) subunit beta [Rhodospirillaceae bacterium]|nr:NAD(P)(+) transhydrogenase (Re/Si-specific) subunit beta [Rhodospirillaceae bacterium]